MAASFLIWVIKPRGRLAEGLFEVPKGTATSCWIINVSRSLGSPRRTLIGILSSYPIIHCMPPLPFRDSRLTTPKKGPKPLSSSLFCRFWCSQSWLLISKNEDETGSTAVHQRHLSAGFVVSNLGIQKSRGSLWVEFTSNMNAWLYCNDMVLACCHFDFVHAFCCVMQSSVTPITSS